jgi:hypothetical protein
LSVGSAVKTLEPQIVVRLLVCVVLLARRVSGWPT